MSSDNQGATRATRTEKDSLGTKEIPASVYYGIQTARAVENYPISGIRAHPTLIRAIGMVKEAAAEANRGLGLVDEKSQMPSFSPPKKCSKASGTTSL